MTVCTKTRQLFAIKLNIDPIAFDVVALVSNTLHIKTLDHE